MAALLEKAFDQYRRGDHKIALATLRRVLQQERRNLNAHLLAGTIHEQQGNLLEAAGFFLSAVPFSGERRREIGLRAASHFLAVGASDKALAALLALHPHLPDDVDVVHGLCSLYRDAGDYRAALPFARKLGEIGREFGNWLNAGIVLSGLGLADEALPLLARAVAEKPDERLAVSELFWCAANACDFETTEAMRVKLEAAYAAEGDSADIRENAFRPLVWSGSEAYHLAAARRTASVMFPPVNPERPPRRDVSGRRIRIGYVSSDFFEHATMALFLGVLEAHDRTAFEVFAFDHTAVENRVGPVRARFEAAVEHVVDILPLDDEAAATLIRKTGIDILVDLKGFTQGNRLGIFCRRPAPVQVTYLGFPGSVAGVGIDYAVTDAIVTPPSSEPFYEERLLRMPAAYQSNDASRPRVERSGARAAEGLPETGIVIAAFHQPQKIRADVISAQMAVLSGVPGSVLWLMEQAPATAQRLRAAAQRHGVAAERLIFAPKRPIADHLARLAEADLAFDTAPYNGHTTTSDALWCGVPVITWRGTSFAGRVSESLLTAVGLPDLVAADLPAAIDLAITLANDPTRRSALRDHLLAARDTAPLFDTTGFTRALEGHYREIAGERA